MIKFVKTFLSAAKDATSRLSNLEEATVHLANVIKSLMVGIDLIGKNQVVVNNNILALIKMNRLILREMGIFVDVIENVDDRQDLTLIEDDIDKEDLN